MSYGNGGKPMNGGMTRNSMKHVVAIVFFTVSFLVWKHAAFALCMEYYDGPVEPSVEYEFRRSTVVFVGLVVSAEQEIDEEGFLSSTTYTLTVKEMLRGSPSKEIRIYNENASGRFDMDVGTTYLVFAASDYDGRLWVDNCGNSGELSKKAQLLPTLREIKPGPPSPIEKEFYQSTAVFVGLVESMELTPASKDSPEGTTYMLTVKEVFRGAPEKKVRVFSENGSGQFPMSVGSTYLVFAHRCMGYGVSYGVKCEVGQLWADNHGNSGEVSQKADALAELRNIKLQNEVKRR